MKIDIDDALKKLADADAKVARHQALLDKAKTDRDELRGALDVLSRHIPELKDVLAGGAAEDLESRPHSATYQSGSIADVILIVMRKADKVWWTANELQDLVSKARGSDVPMTSISPNLSKLKNNGDIVRADRKVALTERTTDQGKSPSEGLFCANASEGIFDSGNNQPAEPPAEGREAVPGGGP